jgi:type IV pilus assembly protein PilB
MASRAPIPPPTLIDLDALARRFRLPIADLSSASSHAVALVPERWARRFHIVPLSATEQDLFVATADPLDVECERTLAFATGRHVHLALANTDDIARRIDELYRGEGATREPETMLDVQHLNKDSEGAPPIPGEDSASSVTNLVDELIAGGIASRASDIHIEPEEQGIAVRHRVDGLLTLARTLPRAVGPALVSRIKILSGLDIADRLRPQDGRARVAINGVAVDLRVSTLPASHGEKVVIRVLDGRSAVLTLEGMGFLSDELDRIERLLQCREGLILVTGPTGSGKTTTLYAALSEIKTVEDKIITIEDPVEYQIRGITQIPVNEKKGLTFARGLRSILRHDPDKIMVGEIRDTETAQIAIQSALTGHLVFTTVHANNVVDVLGRFLNMGVEPYNFVSALNCILAQRLVRLICNSCRTVVHYPPDVLEASGLDPEQWSKVSFYEGQGCIECAGTGFRGRTAIHELLDLSDRIREMILAKKPTSEIRRAAREEGMRFLRESALDKVRLGLTTLKEINKVTFIETMR